MLRIFPRQLRFDLRIMFPPEIGQILRHLDRLHAGRENVHRHRHAAQRNLRRLVHVVKLLYAQRDERRPARLVIHLGRASVRQREPFGRVLVQQFPLRVRKPRRDDGFHLALLDILVAHRAVAQLLDDGFLVKTRPTWE